MADNTTPSANASIATDDIGGTHYQRVKIGRGVDGAYRDSSDSYTTGTINAANANLTTGTPTANSAVTITVPDTHASWSAFLNGTWSTGTRLRFQASPDNISWYAVNGRISGASSTNELATDLYADPTGGILPVPVTFMGNLAGARYFRVTCETYTASDSITVQLVTSEALASMFQHAPLPSGVNRLGQVALTDGLKASYSAALNNTIVASATTTSVPIWEIQNPTGSGKILRVIRLEFAITLATAAAVNLHLVKRAVSTGGTAVAQTKASHDSTNSASAAVVNLYTAAPTAGSQATGGIQRHWRGWAFATTITATTSPPTLNWDFGTPRSGSAIALRAGEALSFQSPVAFGTAPTITGSVEWTEEVV